MQTTGQLNDDRLLLVEQWVAAYKKVSDDTVEQIKQEAHMTPEHFPLTTVDG